MIESKYPGTKTSLLRTGDRLVEILRREMKPEEPLGYCRACGEPSADRECKACQFRREFS